MYREQIKKQVIPFRLKFLMFVVALYILVAIDNLSLAQEAFINTVVLFYHILPILVSVFILNVVMNKYLKAEIIEKYIGDKQGVAKVFYAVVLGIVIAGAPYILYPMLGDLKKKGASNDFLAIMLFNRNVKIPFIPAMIYYFGLSFTVVISLLIIVFSVLNGYLVSLLVETEDRVIIK